MALLAGSPALDAGSNALVPAGVTTDQRGLPRISNGTVDIGAFESQVVIVPSFVVDTAADVVDPGDGKTSLREAIAYANAAPGHTISFDPVVFPANGSATIQLINDLQHGTLEIAGDVTIIGPGSKAVTVRGGGAASNFSVFTIDSRVTAKLSGLTIAGGNANSGGGIE
jgi:CSLREA domain-containing protein